MLLPLVRNIFNFIDDPLGYEIVLRSQLLKHDKDDGRSLLTRPINQYFLSFMCDRLMNNTTKILIPKNYQSTIPHIIAGINILTRPFWRMNEKTLRNQRRRDLPRILFEVLTNFLEVLLVSFSQIFREPNPQSFVVSYVTLRDQVEKIFHKSLIEELCQAGSSIKNLTRDDLRTLAGVHGLLTFILPLTIDPRIAEVIRSTIISIQIILNEISGEAQK
jgi:hypothetical protein